MFVELGITKPNSKNHSAGERKIETRDEQRAAAAAFPLAIRPWDLLASKCPIAFEASAVAQDVAKKRSKSFSGCERAPNV